MIIGGKIKMANKKGILEKTKKYLMEKTEPMRTQPFEPSKSYKKKLKTSGRGFATTYGGMKRHLKSSNLRPRNVVRALWD